MSAQINTTKMLRKIVYLVNIIVNLVTIPNLVLNVKRTNS